MGTVYKRKGSPFWWIKWYDPRIPGFKFESSKLLNTDNNRKKAEKLVEQREAAKKLDLLPPNFEYIHKQQKLLSECFDMYLEYKQVRKNERLAKKSVTSYTSSVDHFKSAVGDHPVDVYTEKHCALFEKYMDKNQFSDHTQGLHTRQLRAVFNWFIKQDMITKNPIYVIRPRKKEPLPIPKDEMQTLFNFLLQEKFIPLLIFNILLLMTGLRPNELLNIKRKNVNFNEDYFIITNFKGKKDNVIKPLFQELKKILLMLKVDKLDPEEKILSFYASYESYKSAWKRAMTSYKKKYNTRYQMKQFRKNFASYLIESGLDIYDVHQVVGHSDVGVLMQYYVAKNRIKIKNEIDSKVKFFGGILPADLLTSLN